MSTSNLDGPPSLGHFRMAVAPEYRVYAYASPADRVAGKLSQYKAQVVFLGPEDQRGILVNSISQDWVRYMNRLEVPEAGKTIDWPIETKVIDEEMRAREIALKRLMRKKGQL